MRVWGRKTAAGLLMAVLLSVRVLAMPTYLVPVGQAVGIQMCTDGVLIVGFTDASSPASHAGLEVGDRICCVNGVELADAKTLRQMVENANGEALTLTVRGRHHTGDYAVLPKTTSQGDCLGLLVRDSTTGVGTITYYDPLTGRYGALGHGILDQSGELLPLAGGQLTPTEIVTVQPSTVGTPGALQGLTLSDAPIGTVDQNRSSGIYGSLTTPLLTQQALPLAQPEEIQVGPAQIWTTLSQTQVQCFDISILKCSLPAERGEKELLLLVTDPQLLAATGGIVQGMSGSPILQNGKLVGAVTHVLVNDPTYGYGISIQSMLEGDCHFETVIP